MSDRFRTLICCIQAFVLIISSASLSGQIHHPDPGFIYDDSEVARIDITIAPENLALLEADPFGDTEYPAGFTFTRGEVSERLDSIGLRYRGNTSRGKQKKSYRISFDSFDDGRAFHGVEKLNLNAETNDPSMLRSKVSWYLFRYMGLPACRHNHVLLYINGAFFGVYNNTEHIDDKFVRSRFGKNDGNLYKCLWPADLDYRGSQGGNYKQDHEGRRAYDLRINEEWDDYQDLADFISTLHNRSSEQFRSALEASFNVQLYLKAMAVDVMTGNWDGYIGNWNNFYLYRDPDTRRFEYIAYDLDNTMGIDWLGEDWSERSAYAWNRQSVPLYEFILEEEIYRNQFSSYLRRLATFMQSDTFGEMLRSWHQQIRPWVEQDPYYPLDFSFSMNEFDRSLEHGEESYGHLQYGILEFAALRAASAMEESPSLDVFPQISYAIAEARSDLLELRWSVDDDMPGYQTWVEYQWDQGVWKTEETVSEIAEDSLSGIKSYRCRIQAERQGRIQTRIRVKDSSGQEVSFSGTAMHFTYPWEGGPLVINEFMASNDMAVADEFGEYDDWIEFYNRSDQSLQLGDYYLSDDYSDPGRFRFPELSLAPRDFFLLWLDDDPEQGPGHTPFKLSREGEEIRLSLGPSTGYELVDSLSYGEQTTDISFGRINNGGILWQEFVMSTPGISNLPAGEQNILAGKELRLYPNPVVFDILYFSREVSGEVFCSNGSLCMQVRNASQISTSGLEEGLYLFRSSKGKSYRFVIGPN